MDAIAKNVYIEDRYLGVTLGVITQPRRLDSNRCAAFTGRWTCLARCADGDGQWT